MFACHGAYSEEFGCLSASGFSNLSLHACMRSCISTSTFVYLIIKNVNLKSSLQPSVFLSGELSGKDARC